MNPTNDPALKSWVSVPAGSHFPIQNLPLGAFRRAGEVHVGVAIGGEILDVTVLQRERLLRRLDPAVRRDRSGRHRPDQCQRGDV